MGWFSRRKKWPQQKHREAAIKVASNLYLVTSPGGEHAVVPLQFTLPDSPYRHLIFCMSATAAACAPEMDLDAVSGALEKLALVALERPQEFAITGLPRLKFFLNTWTKCLELDKKGDNQQAIEMICLMLHSTESDVPGNKDDVERLRELARWIHGHFPAMRDAYVESLGQAT
jgi:hypothetical protein